MNRLHELETRLAAQVAAMKVPDEIEAKLLGEFDKRRRRILWLIPIAAMLAAIAWLTPRPGPVHAPLAQTAAPAPVREVHVTTVKPRRARRRNAAKRAPVEDEPEFIRIPFSAPLGLYERAEIVHAEIPVSALTAAGIQVATADTGAKAQADLLVGEDGIARAVRLISISSN